MNSKINQIIVCFASMMALICTVSAHDAFADDVLVSVSDDYHTVCWYDCMNPVFEFRAGVNPGVVLHDIYQSPFSDRTYSSSVFDEFDDSDDYTMFKMSLNLSFGVMWMNYDNIGMGLTFVQELGFGKYTGDVSDILDDTWFIGGSYLMFQFSFVGDSGVFFDGSIGLGVLYSDGDKPGDSFEDFKPAYIQDGWTAAFRAALEFGYYFTDNLGFALDFSFVLPIGEDRREFGPYDSDMAYHLQPGIQLVYRTDPGDYDSLCSYF